MTDLCQLEAALHDIRRSNQIMEVLIESVSSNVKALMSVANLPAGITADDRLLEFEINRQSKHCADAETILAGMQKREPETAPNVFLLNLKRTDLQDGTEIILAGKPHTISRSLIGPDWWDCRQGGELMASFPARHLLKHAWVQGAKRH